MARTWSFDWRRVVKLALACLMSGYVGYKYQPMVSDNPNAVNAVITIFSILAGFLIAVITFIAEPTLQQARSWQELQLMKKTVENKLLRQKILFFLYLFTLGVALVMYLVPQDMDEIQKYLQISFLSLATFVFLASFSLPGSLMRIQMERYEAALDKTRPKVLKDIDADTREASKISEPHPNREP